VKGRKGDKGKRGRGEEGRGEDGKTGRREDFRKKRKILFLTLKPWNLGTLKP